MSAYLVLLNKEGKRQKMKISCSKAELQAGINTVQLGVSTKTTLPILSNFLLEAEKDKIKLASTDLEVGIRTLINAEVSKPGQITIPAKKVAEIIHELPNAKIEIQTDEANRISINCANSHFVINGLPKEDYPSLPEFKEEKAITLPRLILQKMLKKTFFAASTDETRYVLNGIFFVVSSSGVSLENEISTTKTPRLGGGKQNEAKGISLLAVATDGRRLAYIRTNLPMSQIFAGKSTGAGLLPVQVIIPTKTVNKLTDLLAQNEEENVAISVTENQVGFKIKDTILISRLIEGTFPNYEQVIPKSYTTQMKIKTKDCLQVTKRVSLLVSEKGGSVKYTLNNNKLKVSSVSPGIGEAEEEMTIDYQGDNFEIAFNPTYLLDALKAIESEEVFFEFTGALNPGLLRPVHGEPVRGEPVSQDKDEKSPDVHRDATSGLREEYLCILMPMRIE